MAVRGQEEFKGLPFQEKLDFLYGLPAREKRDLILAVPEAERLVQSFAPETLFYTLKEIGSADAGELLELALPDQIKGLVDLDCWDRDRPNLVRMREWLEALADAGRKRVADALMELDIELVSLLLRGYLKVHRLDEPELGEDAPSSRYLQFGEHYLVEFTRSDSVTATIQDFLDEAFARDFNYFAALMEEIYWGVEAELEEQAYGFRSARLADRGFPDYFDAQDVFAYLNPAQFEEIRAGCEPPHRDDTADGDVLLATHSVVALAGAGNSLFNTALTAGFAADGKRQLRSEMAAVTNQVLVARAIDFGDLDAVKETVETTHDYLNLGLEHLAGGDLQAAVEALRDTHLKLLFRLGVSLTIDLRTRAEALVAGLGLDPRRNREIGYLDSPYREALNGFLARQPRFFGGLDRGGAVLMRDFRAMSDLHLAYAVLDQVEAMRDLMRALPGIDIASAAFRAEAAAREIRLSQILLTALVRYGLERRLNPPVLEASRLAAAHAAIMTGNGRPARLNAAFLKSVDDALAGSLDGDLRRRSAAFVQSCLNRIEEEWAGLDSAQGFDPRFLNSILIGRD